MDAAQKDLRYWREKINMDFVKWIEENKDRVMRYWTIKKHWTPYEMQHPSKDQSYLFNEECDYGYFLKAIPLPCMNDYLIEVAPFQGKDKYKYYYKLSELEFNYVEEDQEQ